MGMRERLPGYLERQLEPQALLVPQAIHKSVGKMLSLLQHEFGMAIPPINSSLVLFRWIKDLTLPLEVFVATQRLARLLRIDFEFGNLCKYAVLRYPEARLMALVIIATKLLSPLDSIDRGAESSTELSVLTFDWNEWMKTHTSTNEQEQRRDGLTFEQAFSFNEKDCLNAADETVDAYLKWCSENISAGEVRERGPGSKDGDFRRALFQMFPLDLQPSRETRKQEKLNEDHDPDVKLQNMQATRVLRKSVDYDGTTHRMGSFYRRYRSVEDLCSISKVFFEKAATLAGLSIENMVQAVFLIERKLQKQEEAFRKAEVAG